MSNDRLDNVIPLHKPLVTTEREWVRCWLLNNGAQYDYKSGGLTINGEVRDRQIILKEMNLDCSEDPTMAGGHDRKLISDAFDVWVSRRPLDYIKQFKTTMTYVKSEHDLVAKYVHAVTGRSDELDIAVMRHFIWQIRRKLFGLEVVHHLMPILYGRQGSGKSKALERLFKPMETLLTKPRDLTQLTDVRSQARFNKYFICFIDEMGQAAKADSATLKSTITDSMVDWRPMGTNDDASKSNNCTFIGASNESVSDLIRDTTGLRRFYELVCAEATDRETINNMDYDALWRSVDETQDAPILPLLDKLTTVQQQSTAINPIDMWFEEQEQLTSEWSEWPSASDVYEEFAKHAIAKGITSQKFFNRMKDLLGPDRFMKTRTNNRYNINIKTGWMK